MLGIRLPKLKLKGSAPQPAVYAVAEYMLLASGRKEFVVIGCGSGRELLHVKAPNKIGIDSWARVGHRKTHPWSTAKWIAADTSSASCLEIASLVGRESVVLCAGTMQLPIHPEPLLELLAACYQNGAIIVTTMPVEPSGRLLADGTDARESALMAYASLLDRSGLPNVYAGFATAKAHSPGSIVTIHDKSIEDARADPLAISPPVAIIAAYNELDVIREVVEDLVEQGCDVFAIDNWSTDGTWEALGELSGQYGPRVRRERFPLAGPKKHYEWGQILRRKEEIAMAFPGRWIVHTDADEIRRSPFPNVSLSESLAIAQRTGANRVGFTVANFRPTDKEPFVSGTLRSCLRHFEFGNRRGHFLQKKAWLQGKYRIDLASSGGHVSEFAGARDFPYRFLLCHYPIRSVDHGRRKVLLERQGRWSSYERRVLGWHSQYDRLAKRDQFLWNKSDLLEWKATFWQDYGLVIMTDLLERYSIR